MVAPLLFETYSTEHEQFQKKKKKKVEPWQFPTFIQIAGYCSEGIHVA